jgi:hypothetical protein
MTEPEYHPGWVRKVLKQASQKRRSVIIRRDMSPAEAMDAGLGFEDWLYATGKMDVRLHDTDPAEYERARLLFVPLLRRPKFGERIYNAEGGE